MYRAELSALIAGLTSQFCEADGCGREELELISPFLAAPWIVNVNWKKTKIEKKHVLLLNFIYCSSFMSIVNFEQIEGLIKWHTGPLSHSFLNKAYSTLALLKKEISLLKRVFFTWNKISPSWWMNANWYPLVNCSSPFS